MAKLYFLAPHSPFFRLLLIITFFLAASLIPFAGLLFLLTLPLVLFVLCVLNDPIKAVAAFFIGFCLLLMILSLMQAMLPVFAVAAMGLAGILMARATRQKYSIELIVLLPSLVVLGAIVLYFVYGGVQLSITPWQLVEKHVAEAVELNIKFYSRLPLNPEEINALNNSKSAITLLFTRIFPALCMIAVFFTIWINVLLGNKLLRRPGIILPGFQALAEWKAPNWLVWLFIAGGGLSFVPHPLIRYAGINLFLVASFIYLLQGLAIVSFFFQRRNVSTFFRWLFYFLIAIQQILMIAIAAVGFFDIWIDFRKYFRKDQSIN